MINAKVSAIRILPGAGIALTSFYFMALERLGVLADYSAICSLAMFALIAAYLLREFLEFREHTISYFYQVFYFVGVMASAILISNGAYMVEIKKIGNANGVFWILAIFFVAGLEASRFAYYKGIRRFQSSISPCIHKDVERYFVLIVVGVALLLTLFVFFRYSSPLILGIERAGFWNSIVPNGFTFIPSLIFQTFFLAMALYWPREKSNKGKRVALLIIFLYLLSTVVVLGQKFSAFIIYFMIFLLFLAAHNPRFRISLKVVFWCGFAAFLVVGLVVYSYIIIGRNSDFILIRLALQSQLNWSVLNTADFPWSSSAPWACFWGCQFESGLNYISYNFLPESVYYHYTEGGTGLSGFLPALPILTFGLPIALLLHVVFSFFTGTLQAYLVSQIRRRNIIYSFLVFKIYFALVLYWYAALQSIAYSKAFALALFLCLLLLILLYLVKMRNKYRHA